MAAYPSHTIGLGSSQNRVSGWKDDISSSGTMHSVQLHGKQYFRFNLIHPGLTVTQFNALAATYDAGPKDVYTLTYGTESPLATYSVKFLSPPQKGTNHGNGKLDVKVALRGFKD